MAFPYGAAYISAIFQFVLGILCILIGVLDTVLFQDWQLFTTQTGVAIWMGAWICITGVIGMTAGYRRHRNTSSNALVGTYMGFSITSTAFATAMIACYSIVVSILSDYGFRICTSYNGTCHRASITFNSLILFFAILEFAVGIWAAICCCMGCPCRGYVPLTTEMVPAGQVLCGPVTGYVLTQGPGGTTIAVPVQADTVQQGAGNQRQVMCVASGGAPMQPFVAPGNLLPPTYHAAGQQQLQAQGVESKVLIA